jgi:alkylation response protein AidB-like acyl-CoA dehydrogenase
MADLSVTPKHVEEMAKKQDQAAEKIAKGAKAADGLGTSMWVSHGPICGYNNTAVEKAEVARRTAAVALQTVCTDLAAGLRAGNAMYASTDHQSEEQIDKQVLPQ